MKLKSTLSFTIFFVAVIVAQAQESKTTFGIKTGLNLSIFSASINSESSFKPGFHLGVYMLSRLNEEASLRIETYYSRQGQRDNYKSSPQAQSSGSTITSVDYLNIPVLLEIGKKVNFQVGPQLGFLLYAHEKGIVDKKPIDDDLKPLMKSTDFSFVLGAGLNATEKLNFGVRVNIGLISIFIDTPRDLPDIKNRVFHFYIGHSF